MLKTERVVRKHRDIRKIRKMYNGSFPDNERIPFDILMFTLSDERAMEAVYDDDRLIGMYYLFLNGDLIYLSYICVEEKERGKGYGSAILNHISENRNGKRIVLDIEEVKDDEQYDETRKRKDFYLHNGYEETGVFYHFYGVDYELLSYGGKVSKDEWHSLILKHWGERANTAIYRF